MLRGGLSKKRLANGRGTQGDLLHWVLLLPEPLAPGC
jgi:hypothetical protein